MRGQARGLPRLRHSEHKWIHIGCPGYCCQTIQAAPPETCRYIMGSGEQDDEQQRKQQCGGDFEWIFDDDALAAVLFT